MSPYKNRRSEILPNILKISLHNMNFSWFQFFLHWPYFLSTAVEEKNRGNKQQKFKLKR